MKTFYHGFVMCQSMFCSIPCPSRVWDEKARPKMLMFLPVVGLEIGLIWWGLSWLCGVLNVPELVRGVVLCVCPYLLTGFIHLDGFLDVTDAVGSCRDLEKRRAILKDSHVGAFAVIGCVLLMLAGFACCASAGADGKILILVPVISRCGSALAVTCLRPMSTSQYAGAFKEGVSKGQVVVLSVMLAASFLAGLLVCGKNAVVLAVQALAYGWALRKGVKSLEGMNGDISGYALTLSELAAVAVWALL